MMLSLDTAYRSFGGEVEASSTPTICRLPDSRRHQLWAIAQENEYHSDGCDTLHLKREIGHQPTDDGDGDNRTERSNDENAQQAAKVTPGWPATGILHSQPSADPECHEGTSQQCNDIQAERKTVLPSGRLIVMPAIENRGRNNPRRAQYDHIRD